MTQCLLHRDYRLLKLAKFEKGQTYRPCSLKGEGFRLGKWEGYAVSTGHSEIRCPEAREMDSFEIGKLHFLEMIMMSDFLRPAIVSHMGSEVGPKVGGYG
jgi:hypothetical protein